MSVSEAKSILILYRPGMAEANDPPMDEALALAKSNPELSLWLETHCATQEALRVKFSQITPPDGLKEQIISEHAANARTVSKKPRTVFLVAVVVLLLLGTLAVFWVPGQESEKTLTYYKNDMMSVALRGYGMDVVTNDVAPIQAYLAQKSAPNFTLPARLQKATLAGCAVEDWQGTKVSLVCFRTGKPLPPGAPADLWLFVVDRASVKNTPPTGTPQLAKINRLMTATWTDGNKLYLLGVEGEEPDIKQYL